jgi:probable O-glycosylation ligase (exosortase A-associated)
MKAASKTNVESDAKIPAGSNLLYYGLILVFLLEYVRLGYYIPFLNSINANVTVPIATFIFTLFSYNNNSSAKSIFSSINFKFIAYFLVLVGISTLFSDIPKLSQEVFSACIGYSILFIIIRQNVNTLDRMKGVFFVLIFCHILLILMNFEVVSDPSTRSYIKNNPFLGDGNDFSLSLCITIPLCLFLFNNTDTVVKKILYLLFFVLLILAVIGTSSRGGSLSLVSMLVYFGYKSKSKLKYILFSTSIIVLVFVYAPPTYFNRLENVNNWQEASAQGRINAWKAAIEMAGDYPLLGVGAGLFPIKYESDYQRGKIYKQKKTAHSMYFLALGELGIPGMFFVLSFVIINFFKNERIIRQMKHLDREAVSLEDISLIVYLNASLVGFSVAAMFLSVLYYPHIFVLAGLMASARSIVGEG